MSPTLFRLLARSYLAHFVVVMGVVLVVYLVADFGDRMRMYAEAQTPDVIELFFNKALVMVGQLGPAAMLLAAGAAISALRQKGELTALRALGVSPLWVVLPVLTVALGLSAGLVVFEDVVASAAGTRVDKMQLERFHVYGDVLFHYAPRQWLRLGREVFQVRSMTEPTELDNVTVYTLNDDFSLSARLDVGHMKHVAADEWLLSDVRERYFGADAEQHLEATRRQRFVGTTKDTFRIRPGRPEQMKLSQLDEQAQLRAQVGLSTRRYEFAWHQRLAGGLLGVVAAALAAALAMRPNRRGHLTVALLEGGVVAAVLWGLTVVGKTLALAEHLSAPAAAWGPLATLLVLVAAMYSRLQTRA